MTKKENKIYRKSTVRYDGFSLVPKSGKFCATSAFCVRTQDGQLSLGAGRAYLSIKGVDVCAPEGQKVFSLGVLPKHSGGEVYNSPVLSTEEGIWLYSETTRDFTRSLVAGSRARFFLLPRKDEEIVMGIVLPNNFWMYGASSGVKKGCDKSFRGAVCVYANRLFAVDDENKLTYSAPYDYANFTNSADEGGYLTVTDKGDKILQLVPREKELYVITAKHIFRLAGNGAARDFVVRKVPYAGGSIYEGSAAVAGEDVVFLASDGVYLMKNDRVERLSTTLNTTRHLLLGEGAVLEGTYYIPCQVDDEKKTLTIDLTSGEYAYSHYVPLLCVYNEDVYGVDENGRVFTYQTGYPEREARFIRNGENFANAFDKTLKHLRLYGEGEVTISVVGRNGSRQERVMLRREGTQIPVLLKGKAFDISISLSVGGYLTALEGDIVQLNG